MKSHRRAFRRDPISPLRYPGGKALLTTYISCVLEENYLTGCSFYEPYVGGASVSMELLRSGFIANAVWVERDPLVYAFWHSVFNETEALCAAIDAAPVTIATWRQLQPLREADSPNGTRFTLLQLGVAGLFFNRTNFSGIMGAGPIGGEKQQSKYSISCRFNKEKIIRQIQLASTFRGRVEVLFGNALTVLRRRAQALATGFTFVYIDPPYYGQGKKLYRYSYEDEEHRKLAEFITAQGYPWLVSYDDHPRIRSFYVNNAIQPIYLDYKAKSSRRAQELVISNLVIPPPIYGDMVILPAPEPMPAAVAAPNF